MKTCKITLRLRAWLCWALLAALLAPPASLAAKKQSGDAAGKDKTDLFDKVGVIKIRIELTKAALDGLQKSYTNDTFFVEGKIEEAGRAYDRVGLHLRGVSTFEPVEKKPNFTLKFNEFVPGQHFHGLRKVRLSNAATDKTYMQEMLASELFRAAGVATPRINYARVELNGRDLGLYVLIEGVTRDFLKQNFGGTDGNLYEGDESDIDERLEQDFGARSRHQTDLHQLALAAKEPDPARRFQQLEKVLDIDAFVSHVAMEVLIDSWDGYSLRINNYRVYCDHDTGRAKFIPHGMDNTFTEPTTALLPEMKGLLSKALLETSEGRARYVKRLGELSAKLMNKEALRNRIEGWAEKIKPTLVELGQDKAHGRALWLFEQRVERRVEFVARQWPILEKNKEGKAQKK